jgi:transposase
MLATLDPLGMPVAVDVAPGQCSDDPLYAPMIDRVRASLGRTGLRSVGDCKLGALDTRAHIHHAGDAYLCPLGARRLPAAAVDALITQALAAGPLRGISRLDADGQPVLDAHGQPVIHAEAWETSVDLTASVDGETVTGTQRRIVAPAPALQARQRQALERRLADAAAALADLLVARRGKVRPTTPDEADAAMTAILERYAVGGLLDVTLTATAHVRPIRAYRGRPARAETTYTLEVTSTRVAAAITAAVDRLGWRVYATNRTAAELDAAQVALAYRDQYLAEHALGRLKGAPLSLSPVYLSRADHVTGLVRLLTLALRALSLLEYGVRRRLAATPQAAPLQGLYAGQPNRATRRPTAEQVLEAFRTLTLTVVALPTQVIRHLTPLTALQQRLLALAGLEEDCYLRLVTHSSKPPEEISERQVQPSTLLPLAPPVVVALEIDKTIPDSAFGQNVLRVCRVLFDLLAQIGDIEPQVVRLIAVLRTPHLAQELLVGHHIPGILHQVVQQPILGRAQVHPFAVHQHLASGKVDLKSVVYLHQGLRRWRRGIVAPQHGANATHQFPVTERLADIIIGAQFQPFDTVLFIVLSGQHQHRHRRRLPQSAQGLETIHHWHHNVQQHDIGHLVAHLLQRLTPVRCADNPTPLKLQIHAHEIDHARLVINDEDQFVFEF